MMDFVNGKDDIPYMEKKSLKPPGEICSASTHQIIHLFIWRLQFHQYVAAGTHSHHERSRSFSQKGETVGFAHLVVFIELDDGKIFNQKALCLMVKTHGFL
jgi:hypothetical protein